jgi:hypothetical protein
MTFKQKGQRHSSGHLSPVVALHLVSSGPTLRNEKKYRKCVSLNGKTRNRTVE